MALLALLVMVVVTDAFLVQPGAQLITPSMQKARLAMRSSLRAGKSVRVSRVSMMATEEKKGEVSEPTAEELSFIEKLTPTDELETATEEASEDSDAEQAIGRYRRRRQAARVQQVLNPIHTS